MHKHIVRDTPLGDIVLLASDVALCGVYLGKDAHQCTATEQKPSHPILTQAQQQLTEYFAGVRTTFELPLDAQGTEFQRRVWGVLQHIRYARTCRYIHVARSIGAPTASRAVGTAIGRNPLSIIIPCHRVISSDGSLGGYAGGLDAKAWLLRHEKDHEIVL
jgi:methylated-DNA-[protein]-cysteine S-methyltransferase